VLDRPQNAQFSLAEMDLLSMFANQAAIALDLLQRARRARTVLHEEGQDDLEAVSRLAATLDELEGADRESALRLLAAIDELLAR
jgi:GAF domain-containing protein